MRGRDVGKSLADSVHRAAPLGCLGLLAPTIPGMGGRGDVTCPPSIEGLVLNQRAPKGVCLALEFEKATLK